MFHLHIFGYFFKISAGGFMTRSLPCSLQSVVFGEVHVTTAGLLTSWLFKQSEV